MFLTLSAHLGRLFVFVISFLVTSLFPSTDLKITNNHKKLPQKIVRKEGLLISDFILLHLTLKPFKVTGI